MARVSSIIAAVVLCAFGATAVASGGPLSGNIAAVKVIKAADGSEQFQSADKVRPDDVIEYRLTYANHSDAALRGVAVTDPVPAGTRYVADTAGTPGGVSVLFSIDNGKTFHAWPVRYRTKDANGHQVWAEATPEMVTHLRWTIDRQLKPAAQVTFTYRAIVK